MRAVIQRVSHASVSIEKKLHCSIENGLLILIAFEEQDTTLDIDWIGKKCIQMRIFNDEAGKMNRSVQDIGGDILLISQFTLFAATAKGNRPSFMASAKPEIAIPLYEKTILAFEILLSKKIYSGVFGADMQVSLCNDGPVTILLDSKIKE